MVVEGTECIYICRNASFNNTGVKNIVVQDCIHKLLVYVEDLICYLLKNSLQTFL